MEPYNFEIIASVENGLELLKELESKSPDLVLLDLNMPVMDGNEAFNIICKDYPNTKVMILSLHFEQILIENYIERGAKGYIPKDAIMGNPLMLVNAIKNIKNNGTFIYEKNKQIEIFTKRQKKIIPLIFEGLTNDKIAEEMGITERAIEKQRKKIYINSGAEKIVDFYKYAFSRGLQFLSRIKNK